MNYSTGCAFNLDEMFMNFPYNKLKMSCKDVKDITGDPHRQPLVKRIFRECFKEVLNDVIDNNVTFQLPTGARPSDIHMKRISGDDFSLARRNGKFKEIDFLASFFSGYQLVLNMYSKHFTRTKNIYVDKKLKSKIIENTNNGKQYC